ncbi:MAG TPA: PEP-CTERM sorting domain-containing protein [Pirellulaceae bacterium]|nr:PEP-CTERM sorting domain-containing protein [Pirellulaceae bacterium]HMO93431.1 PEP-CTERM sorting domain-containing protein [Pirellulaceae bacterium]HMP68461.1 PEP-CTERM sorting domain-containing protein [Pirellulaceae bacterium]
MSKILSLTIAVLLTAALFVSRGDASLVIVKFDNFTNTSFAATTLNVGGVSIQRTISLSGANAQFVAGGLEIGRNTIATITYNVLGGQNFGDVFATGLGVPGGFNGFGILTSVHANLLANNWARVSITPEFGTNILNDALVNNVLVPETPTLYSGIAVPSTSQVVFQIANLRPTGMGNQYAQSITLRGLYAIPEPSALLLFGSSLVGGLFLRRRSR